MRSEADAEGVGQAELSCCLSLLEASLSFLSQCAPPSAPAPPVGVHRGEVVDNLGINLSAWGLLVRWCLSGFRSCQMGLPEPVGEGGWWQEPLLQGLEAASPSLGLHIPSPLPRAAFFTTSGYRTLHEFRSQWNYFRILVNRKLRVFHKLSITTVWWEEPGLGASNGCWEVRVHCLRG